MNDLKIPENVPPGPPRPFSDYQRLSIVARAIFEDAVIAHQIVWRGDEVFETFAETPLGKATRTFNEACVLLATLSADAGAMMTHKHLYTEADRCTVCNYDRRPSS